MTLTVCSKGMPDIRTTRGDDNLEVQFYGVADQVWSQRDLASICVLCSCHALVPNFEDWSMVEEIQSNK